MSDQKPAYLVASLLLPGGHGSLDAYGEAVVPILQKHGAEILVFGTTDQSLDSYEGEWKKDARLTLVKFPSMQGLQNFWNSEEYKAIKRLRTDAVQSNFIFGVEGM